MTYKDQIIILRSGLAYKSVFVPASIVEVGTSLKSPAAEGRREHPVIKARHNASRGAGGRG